MPSTKEIRVKIKSVQNTRKITKAMEMVAASKMRKAQDRMRHARPYGDKIRNIVAHLASANPEYRHAFVVKRNQIRNVGLILVSTDKGLSPVATCTCAGADSKRTETGHGTSGSNRCCNGSDSLGQAMMRTSDSSAMPVLLFARTSDTTKPGCQCGRDTRCNRCRVIAPDPRGRAV
jgi:hypothetical protein